MHAKQIPGFAKNKTKIADDSNMIPLINIVFLMLIFFMVAGTISIKDPVSFDAPTANKKQAESLNTERSVLITKGGQLWLDDTPWGHIDGLSAQDWQQFTQQLIDTPSLAIKADAALAAQQLDPLLEQLQSSGIDNIQLAILQAP